MSRVIRCVLLCAGIVASLSAYAGPPTFQQNRDAATLYDLAAREAQHRALAAMPSPDVEYGQYGRVRNLQGHTGIVVAGTEKLKRGDSAHALFQRMQRTLLAGASESLVVREAGRAPLGGGHFLFTNQVIDGIPVIDARVNFLMDANGEVQAMSSLFVPRGKASKMPQISLQTAQAGLARALVETQMADEGSVQAGAAGSLAFWTDWGKEQTPRLLWMFEAQYTKGGEPHFTRFGVDAATGELHYSEQLSFGINRTVYTNNYLTSVSTPQPGTLLWVEGSPNPANAQAFSIYQNVIHPVNALLSTPFGYDTMGLVANYGVPEQSWFLYGTDHKPYFFIGDGRVADVDVIAHEYGHGLFVGRVPHQPPNIRLWDDWFSGNEFWADLASVMTDIHRFGVRSDTWAISDVRNWRDPSAVSSFHLDWYPHRYFANPFVGIAHANSTIYGHAVYLMLNGGAHRRAGALAVGGPIPSFSVPAANPGQVKEVLYYGLWLVAFYNDTFSGPTLKARTMQAANQLYGPAAGVLNTVERAWTAVGIGYNCSGPPAVPQPDIRTQYCMGRYDITWPQESGAKYHAMVVHANSGWDASGQTVTDGAIDNCSVDLPWNGRYRMRACNACGCSAWTSDAYLQFYRPCL